MEERRRVMSFCELMPPHLLPPLPDYAECSQPPPPFTDRRALQRVNTVPSNLTKPLEVPSWPPSPVQTPEPVPRQIHSPLDTSAPRRKKRACYGSFRSEVSPPPAYFGHVQEEEVMQ
ncbi:unnamed protein product [Schistocephalus solidus]|uniref:Uncharacterized protein n=1 Tax=Schistocephalus solidus TaxID=70667 RepID=A0A183SRI0_SCHSO|nr:unnamed protein product [Schistocephalus solidus]